MHKDARSRRRRRRAIGVSGKKALRPWAARGSSLIGVTPRVLVVEDDTTVREITRRYLGDAGYAVDEAADGPAGLRAARTDPPDAVVLDVMLPGLSGLEVCRALRDTAPAAADRDAVRARQRGRPRGGPGVRRRRLRHQAVQRPRAGAAGRRGPAPGEPRRRSTEPRSSTATSSSTRQRGRPAAAARRCRSPGGSSTCSRSCSPTPAAPTPAPSCLAEVWGWSSATSRRSPSTCGGCARRSSPTPPPAPDRHRVGHRVPVSTPGGRMIAELLQAAPLALLFSCRSPWWAASCCCGSDVVRSPRRWWRSCSSRSSPRWSGCWA